MKKTNDPFLTDGWQDRQRAADISALSNFIGATRARYAQGKPASEISGRDLALLASAQRAICELRTRMFLERQPVF